MAARSRSGSPERWHRAGGRDAQSGPWPRPGRRETSRRPAVPPTRGARRRCGGAVVGRGRSSLGQAVGDGRSVDTDVLVMAESDWRDPHHAAVVASMESLRTSRTHQSSAGIKPSCSAWPRSSRTDQCSMTLPSWTRQMWICSVAKSLPVGDLPRNSPRWRPDRQAGDDLVALGDLVLDVGVHRAPEPAQPADGFLEALGALRVARGRLVVDELGMDQFVGRSEVSLLEGLFQHPSGDPFVLLGHVVCLRSALVSVELARPCVGGTGEPTPMNARHRNIRNQAFLIGLAQWLPADPPSCRSACN